MSIHEEVAELSTIMSPDAPILSVYLDISTVPAELETVSPRLRNMLRPIRQDARSLDRRAATSLAVAMDRVLALAEGLGPAQLGHGIAFFGCPDIGLERLLVVPRHVWDMARAGPRPYLRPLHAVLDGIHRIVTVVVEPRGSQIRLSWGDEIQHEEHVEGTVVRKSDYGGLAGLDEQASRGSAAKAKREHYQMVADRIGDLRRSMQPDVLFVGGRSETVDEFLPYLTDRDRRLLGGAFTVDTHTLTPAEIAHWSRSLEAEWRGREDRAVAAVVAETEAAGGLAVTGFERVAEAAALGAVHRLLVDGHTAVPGRECTRCGRLFVHGATCPRCGAAGTPLDDVVERLVSCVLAAGGSVDHLTIETELRGRLVGASLRFDPMVGAGTL